MKILITGAEGFIGSHLASKLITILYINALVLYNSFNSYGWLDTLDYKIKKINIILGDVRDYSSVLHAAKM